MAIGNFTASRIKADGKRICFWGAPETAFDSSGDLYAQLERSGGNSGNIFIGSGLYRNLDCALKEYHPGFHKIPPERLHEYYDYVFMPSSNFVSKSVNLTGAFDYFKRSKVQLFCFGLGSQLLPSEAVELNPGTENFLRLIGERSGSIGVRGVFTAEILWKLGIRNLSLTGCPSLLSLTEDAIKRLSTEKPSLDKVCFNASNNVRRHALFPDEFARTENHLFRRMLEENSFYILQNERPEMDAMMSLRGDHGNKFSSAMDTIRYIFDVRDERTMVDEFFKTRMRMFFDADSWIGCLKSMTASIGSRFHGNIAAILAGTPALVLAHDMRTVELSDLFCIPCLLIDKMYSDSDLSERLLAVDYTAFIKRMNHIRTEWILFFIRNGLGI